MASYHCTVKVGGKGKAASHSAYISREGKYSGRERYEDLESTDYGNMPKWAEHNPAHFWNAADEHERANGATYREIEVALPRELDPAQRRTLVEDFIAQEIGDKHAYQWAIHTPNAALEKGEQPHAHIMYSERTRDGLDRDPEQYFKRYNAKAPEKGGCRKDSAGTEERLQATRKLWADVQNTHLERHGHEARVDHRSLKEQGIDRQPEKHVGASRVKDMQESDIAALLTRRAAEGELERAQQQVGLIDMSGDMRGAFEERDQLQAERQRQRQRRSADLEAEIALLRPAQMDQLVQLDESVLLAKRERDRLENLYDKAVSDSAKTLAEAEAWREQHKIQAWFHDKEIGYAPALRELEQQHQAFCTESLAFAKVMEEAVLRLKEAKEDAEWRITVEQTQARAKLEKLEALLEKARHVEEQAEIERQPEKGRDNDGPDLSL